ncbi:MAG: O-antigen ligase family protein [Prevotellaceae bacterium]|jgi:O-antigen ligase|nr:O-antigen ligase family protein [Prevotellaceae bacterium]
MLRYCRSISGLLSFGGLWFLLAMTIVSTNPELDIQDRYFMWIVAGLGVAALLTAVFAKKQSRMGVIDGLVLLFLLYLFVNYQFISKVDVSTKWFQTVYLFVLYGALRILLQAYKHIDKFLVAGIVSCGLLESIMGLMQMFGYSKSHHHLFVFTGSYVNTGPYGGFLAITMSVGLWFIVRHYQIFVRQCKVFKRFPLTIIRNSGFVLYLLCTLSFSTSFLTFFAAMSRAAILGLLISSLAIVSTQPNAKQRLLDYFKTKRRIKKWIVGTICVALFAVVGATYWIKKDSADGRVLIWKISVQVMANKPLFGSGFGSFFGEYSARSADYFVAFPSSPEIAIADVPEYAFNEYLQIGVETGSVGLLIMLAIMLMACRGAMHSASTITNNPFVYGLIVLMIFAFFSYPFSQLPFMILATLFVAAAQSNSVLATTRVANRISKVSFCTLLVVVSIGLTSFYEEKISATQEWKTIKMFYRSQHYDTARKEFAALYPILKDNPRFLFEYGHALNKTERFAQSNAILEEGAQLSSDPMFYNVIGNNYKGLGETEKSVESYWHAFHILPNRIYPLYLLMKLYAESGQENNAHEMAQRVINFSPKVDSPAVRDMKREARSIMSKSKSTKSIQKRGKNIHFFIFRRRGGLFVNENR